MLKNLVVCALIASALVGGSNLSDNQFYAMNIEDIHEDNNILVINANKGESAEYPLSKNVQFNLYNAKDDSMLDMISLDELSGAIKAQYNYVKKNGTSSLSDCEYISIELNKKNKVKEVRLYVGAELPKE